MGESFADQDGADVPSANRQRATQATIIAVASALLPRETRARHPNQPGVAAANEGAQAGGGRFIAAAFIVATGFVATFRHIESNEAVRRALEADGIAVDHVDWSRLYRAAARVLRANLSAGPALPIKKGRGKPDKRGASVSVGARGAHFTVGPKGMRTTVGLPGTGISYTAYSPFGKNHAASETTGAQVTLPPPVQAVATPPALPATAATDATWLSGTRLFGIAVFGFLLAFLLVYRGQ